MEASMRSETFRHPCIAVHSVTGNVTVSRCTCEQLSDSKCAHTAALLYLVEDLSMKVPVRLKTVCTSAPQRWGQGIKVGKDPQPFHLKRYRLKRDISKVMQFNPIPEKYRKIPDERVNAFISELQYAKVNTMWEDVLRFTYEDYEVSTERRDELKEQSRQFLNDMKENLFVYDTDPHSNLKSWHVSGSESQPNRHGHRS